MPCRECKTALAVIEALKAQNSAIENLDHCPEPREVAKEERKEARARYAEAVAAVNTTHAALRQALAVHEAVQEALRAP